MKKCLAIIAASLLLLPISAVGFSFAASGAMYVKVGLAYGSEAVSECEIKCESGIAVAKAGPEGFEEILALPECKQLSVRIESRNISAMDSSGAIVFDGFDADTCLVSYNFDSGGVLSFRNGLYRGGLSFYQSGSGAMNVINHILLDDYLYGVLNSELNYSNPIEALKAQAVTARSFAMCNTGKHSESGFDFCTGVHCQLYKGYSDEHGETNRAVDETAGQTLTYGGETVSGYYFKNSGGFTQSAEDVWGGRLPHLTGVKDEYSPDYPWRHTMTFQEITSKLNAAGYSIGKLQSVAIKGRTPSGAASSVEFTGTYGTAELKNEKIRTVLGGAEIRSLMFGFSDREDVPPYGGAEMIHVIGEGGTIDKRNPDDIYILSDGEAIILTGYFQTGEVADEVYEAASQDPVTFSGKGYGHGVGMPQDSAVVMANKGFSYEEILKYYYTGVEIN